MERLSNETSQQLSTLSESISVEASSENPSPSSQDSIPKDGESEDHKKQDLGRESVQKEIDELKRKLQQRKMREEVVGDKAVENAKDSVIKCLRENDRRPLDCWREVDAFKREVGRLERGFLGRVWD